MKLAILGTDSDILELAAAARRQQHEIVWIGDVRPGDAHSCAELTAAAADRGAEWELLLDRSIADAVLVGKGTATAVLRAEQLKRLAAEAVPVLIAHPAFDSVLPYYELDMTRRETGAIVQHYNPLAGHPAVPELSQWLKDGHPAIGPIHQLSCERRVTLAAREPVLAHFARDVELLAELAGDIRRVTAIGPVERAASYASFQIQLITPTLSSVRWSVGYAASGAVGLEISLLGENGLVAVHIYDGAEHDTPTWQIEISSQGALDKLPQIPYDPALATVDRLAWSVNQSNERAKRDFGSTWEAATRAMEVVDAAELSLQKGRTIEVFQQQLTERLAFRGTMAALGCGLLLVVFMAVVTVGLLGGLNPFGLNAVQPGAGGVEEMPKPREIPFWGLALFAVLAFFLLLQIVPLLARKSTRTSEQSPAGPPSDHNT